MHYNITNSEGKVTGTVCIDRSTRTCNILNATSENISELLNVAFASKVPFLRILVPSELVRELEELGWTYCNTYVVLIKEA